MEWSAVDMEAISAFTSVAALTSVAAAANKQTTKDKYGRQAYCDNEYLPVDWTGDSLRVW